MDLYRQASAAGGALKLAGVQKRVETMLTMTGAQNFIEYTPTSRAPSKASEPDMRIIKLTTGAPLAIDGDLMTVMEALYKEVSAQHELRSTFEDMAREIAHVIEQMTEGERRQYLVGEPLSQHRLVRE